MVALGSAMNFLLGGERFEPDQLYVVSEAGITRLETEERPMSFITEHHDGHGLNESIVLRADTKDPQAGGASHRYLASIGENCCAEIQFQHGARTEPGSIPGITEAVLYAILLDRLRAFQAGPYACAANDDQIEWLEQCLASTKARADERAARGVLGKNQK
jgi:hypothetical protein